MKTWTTKFEVVPVEDVLRIAVHSARRRLKHREKLEPYAVKVKPEAGDDAPRKPSPESWPYGTRRAVKERTEDERP